MLDPQQEKEKYLARWNTTHNVVCIDNADVPAKQTENTGRLACLSSSGIWPSYIRCAHWQALVADQPQLCIALQ